MTPTPAPHPLTSDEFGVRCAGVRLYSAFQPIVSVTHGRVVGHEALLRGHDDAERPLSPGELFPRLAEELSSDIVHEVCARLHLGTFMTQRRDGWLFLNASPGLVLERRSVSAELRGWLAASGVEPHRVVIEIVESRVGDERRLAAAVEGFRDVGCLVAIDDFGAGESNFERIWRLRPDLVKIDRAMLAEATEDPVVRRLLPGIVSLLHESGCLVVMEGIETRSQALIALESGADFVQGYYFSHPSRGYPEPAQIRASLAELTLALAESEAERQASDEGFFTSFSGSLAACVAALEEGAEFAAACSTFVALAGVRRLFLLDELGRQVGPNLEAAGGADADPRFLPCSSNDGASWARRAYFRDAVRAPGVVQVSRPYLSVRDARACVTLSCAFDGPGGLRVLCADLDQEQGEPLSRSQPRESGIHLR